MKYLRHIVFLGLFLVTGSGKAQSLREQKKFWKQVRKEMPAFRKVFKKPGKYRFEIVYTRIERDPEKGHIYHRYRFGRPDLYFYPASTVKFPMALKAFQRLNRLLAADSVLASGDFFIVPQDSLFCTVTDKSYLAHQYLRVNDSLSTQHAAALGGMGREEFCNINRLDPFTKISPGKTIRLTASPAPLTFNKMMNEMLVYSNNHYFNWLFDFAQQETTYSLVGIDIHKRLMVCPNADSLRTRSLYLHSSTGKTALQPSEEIKYDKNHLFTGGYTVGKKHYDFNGNLADRGRNFSQHNEIDLAALQDQLIELIFPGYLNGAGTYDITEWQRMQLIRYMGKRPSEDKTVTDSNYLRVPDDFTNFLYTGQTHQPWPDHIRIVNVIGQAYGFVTDCAYIADEQNKVDFFLAVRIYVNKDEVLNDDRYEYTEIAYPLMEQLGKVIYRHEQAHPPGRAALPPVFQIFR